MNGIAVAPITPEVLEPAIRRAAEAGIPVVTIDTPPAEGSRARPTSAPTTWRRGGSPRR
ncbi:substrate-binding domain-containing protein [Sorangium sp. So ce176]|uniref:substrate-binding domain-containing protein n=1 Tax=Sorangium sp. So ce176 TaxID=3133286 RepID=UPI003F5F6747